VVRAWTTTPGDVAGTSSGVASAVPASANNNNAEAQETFDMETSSAHAPARPANANQATGALNPQEYHGLPTLSTKIRDRIG
jgi:hypothetical protein